MYYYFKLQVGQLSDFQIWAKGFQSEFSQRKLLSVRYRQVHYSKWNSCSCRNWAYGLCKAAAFVLDAGVWSQQNRLKGRWMWVEEREDEPQPTRMNWYPWPSLTTSKSQGLAQVNTGSHRVTFSSLGSALTSRCKWSITPGVAVTRSGGTSGKHISF